MTRRDLAKLGLGLPAFAAFRARAGSSKEFWNSTPPSDWTASEIQELLNRSPWAQEVKTSENGPGMEFGQSKSTGGGPGSGVPQIGPRQQFVPQIGQGHFKALVRWDSALPIREAMRRKPSPEFDKYYVIALGGDLPDTGQILSGGGAVPDEQRLENLKQFTRLERKGDPILLSRLAPTPNDYPSSGGTLFYFERRMPITADDKQVTFITRVGPYLVRARFNLREMLYHGKLEI